MTFAELETLADIVHTRKMDLARAADLAGASAENARDLWRDPQSELLGAARHIAGMGADVSVRHRSLVGGSAADPTGGADPRRGTAAARALRRRVRRLLHTHVAAGAGDFLKRRGPSKGHFECNGDISSVELFTLQSIGCTTTSQPIQRH